MADRSPWILLKMLQPLRVARAQPLGIATLIRKVRALMGAFA
jgi:hypothetical protein